MKKGEQINEVAPIVAGGLRLAAMAAKPLLKAGAKKLFRKAAKKGIKTIGKKGTRALMTAGKEIAKTKFAKDNAKKAINWVKHKMQGDSEKPSEKQLVESWSQIVDKALIK